MALSTYLVENYKHTHEREIFEELEKKLTDYALESDETLVLIGNISCEGDPLDAVLFKRDAIIVLEFKDYGGKIVFEENGPWTDESGVEIKGGKYSNPFQQVKNYKYGLMNLLTRKNISKSVNLGHITGLLLFHRKIAFDQHTLPRAISPWFKICDLDGFISKIKLLTSPSVNFRDDELLTLEKKLNLRKARKQNSTPLSSAININTIITELKDVGKVKNALRKTTFVGIDFGTSTTVASYVVFDERTQNIITKQIPLHFLNRGILEDTEIWPTVIYYDALSNRIEIGENAKARKYDAINGVNYWSSFKMQLGKDEGNNFTNSQLNGSLNSETILNNKDATRVFFKLIVEHIKKYLAAQQLSENYKFCISIPASFEANQRQDLFEVILDSGISVDANLFIDEPNAAFLSYMSGIQTDFFPALHKTFTLVFDFGAGTCDVSIIELGEKPGGYYSKNLAISKFEEIGGDNIDRLISRQVLFPALCKLFSLKRETISDAEYEEHFEKRLVPLAEMFKISFNRNIRQNPLLRNKDKDISKEEKIIFQFRGEKYTLDEMSMNYIQFDEVMSDFLKYKVSSKNIIAALHSAINKAKLSTKEIDNVLFIGGSCLSPYVIDAVSKALETSNMIIPRNLQTHVSSGTAINSFLVRGLNLNPLVPIISEPISIKTKDGKSVVILEAGTEIPSSGKTKEGFQVSVNQKVIEIPIYVSGSKLLQTTSIVLKEQALVDLSITIISEVDRNKLITIKVYNKDILLQTTQIQPFANEVLTTYQIEVKKLIKEINNLLVKKSQRIYVRLKVDELVAFHAKENNHIEAFNTLVKYSPESYVNLSYHAWKAGLKDKVRYYKKLAYDKDNKNGASIYNYALESHENSAEYFNLMMEAIEKFNYPSAKLAIAQVLKKRGEKDKSIKMFSEVLEHFSSEFKKDPTGLHDWEYAHLITACTETGNHDLMKNVMEIRQGQTKQSSAEHRYTNGNLLDYKT